MQVNYQTGGLVKLSPQPSSFGYGLESSIGRGPAYYRILGSETTLLYAKEVLIGPTTRMAGYEREFLTNLETIICALEDEKNMRNPEKLFLFDIYVTARNYAKLTDQPSDLPELRNRFQKYRLLFSNTLKQIPLTSDEDMLKEEFVRMLDFFITLETRYSEWRFHHQDDDDE